MSRPVTVFGSINVDLVARVDRLPAPGETVPGGPLEVLLGGKGANQAVAAARAGADARLVGCAGKQSFGLPLADMMAGYGVDISGVCEVEGPSGAALIAVDATGENSIVVSPGANALTDAPAFADPPLGSVTLAQLELPPAEVLRYFERTKAGGGLTMLNTAPAIDIPNGLFDASDVLIFNETEFASYSGADPSSDDVALADAARAFRRRQTDIIVITLGARGALAVVEGETHRVTAPSVEAIDATGAGDCFCGALAARIADGAALDEALRYANVAASLSVTKPSAAQSMPPRADVDALI
ncbi:MAG: ribokinase [Pseudomonadota bacterium]